MALPSRLFCDTSFFYACLDPNDSNHNRAEELIADAIATRCVRHNWDTSARTVTLFDTE